MYISPSKSKLHSENLNRSNTTNNLNPRLNTFNKSPSKTKIKPADLLFKDVYFCHYQNAMYMGGAKAFEKHGRGLLLHDNGTSAITSYYNNLYDGEVII
jgi:hypothetical protein